MHAKTPSKIAYDPDLGFVVDDWQAADEGTLMQWIAAGHDATEPGWGGGNPTVHAGLHLAVERQAAGLLPDVQQTLVRLVDEGVPRHDVIHVLMACSLEQSEHGEDAYLARLRDLNAESAYLAFVDWEAEVFAPGGEARPEAEGWSVAVGQAFEAHRRRRGEDSSDWGTPLLVAMASVGIDVRTLTPDNVGEALCSAVVMGLEARPEDATTIGREAGSLLRYLGATFGLSEAEATATAAEAPELARLLARSISEAPSDEELAETLRSLGVDPEDPEAVAALLEQMQNHGPVRRKGPRIGRNAPCPCGSGKKFKKCCGRA